jgi:glycosyltransferase involved in cell wall biosynthesis
VRHVSVFTPSHDARFLDQAYASLLAQTYTDWEWVVVLNQRARWQPAVEDERLRLFVADDLEGVGAAKQRACSLCRGEILVELDHDDELTTDCLEKVVLAFEAFPEAGFVYSDFAQIDADGNPDPMRFDERHGWIYYEATVDGRDLLVTKTLDPSPHNVSFVWYAPNHVRAFRRDDYDDAGGYDPVRTILDDQDLMMRLWQVTDFHCIHEPLYLQRMHESNTQRNRAVNEEIQRETVVLYDASIEANVGVWAVRNGLNIVNLETPELPDADAESLGLVIAHDVLNLVDDPISWLNHLWWLLAHGGMLLTLTPSTDGPGAWADLRSRSYWNELTFERLGDHAAAHFQTSRLVTYPERGVPYVCANLIALKENTPRFGGLLPAERYASAG